jgi:hypothetical protein
MKRLTFLFGSQKLGRILLSSMVGLESKCKNDYVNVGFSWWHKGMGAQFVSHSRRCGPQPTCSILSAVFLFCFGFVFGVTGDWTQCLALAKQVLYHWSHMPSPFALSLFSQIVLHFYLAGSNYNPPTSTSRVAEIAVVHHNGQPQPALF